MNQEEIEQRVAAARKLHQTRYNCAQSVALAYKDMLPVDEETLAQMMMPFGGGIARLREVCGCVSAMALVASHIEPEPRANTMLVQSLAAAFKQANGDIVCHRLLGLDGPLPNGLTKKPCTEYVACAARLLGEAIAAKTTKS